MFNKINVHKYSEQLGLKEEMELLAIEEKYEIFLNNQEIISLLCTPMNLDELALGFLTTEGFICHNNSYWEINIRENNKEINVYAEETRNLQKRLLRGTITSGCGQGATFSEGDENSLPIISKYQLSLQRVLEMAKAFQKASLFENSTRGLHSAALLLEDQLIIRKDVGRHNAVDKIAGHCIINNIQAQGMVLLLTGRITSEIISKGAKLKIPFIVSFSGATSRAVEMAQELGISLLGYVRGKTAIIFSHPEQIDS